MLCWCKIEEGSFNIPLSMSKVALVGCPDYDREQVYAAVSRGICLIGGASQFVKPGENILLKPNVLVGASPEKCVTTHPAVFAAAGRLLQEAGAEIRYGDSPAFGRYESNMKRAGLKQVGDEMGFGLVDFGQGREVSHQTALLNRKFVIADAVLDADGIISLPKLKTHGLTRLTGAVKNQFGCIPGILKGQFHVKMADPYEFATMLVDLNTRLRPRMYIMDAIVAMEGNGPRNGRPRQIGALLFSTDPVALDAVACRLVGLNPEFMPTSKPGEDSGLGTYHSENIEIAGDRLESFVVKDFDIVKRPPARATAGRLRKVLRNWLVSRPVIDLAKCTECGTCIEMCPVGPTALDWMQYESGKAPRHYYQHCIRCYCCQEVCPEGAITVEETPLSRLFFRT